MTLYEYLHTTPRPPEWLLSGDQLDRYEDALGKLLDSKGLSRRLLAIAQENAQEIDRLWRENPELIYAEAVRHWLRLNPGKSAIPAASFKLFYRFRDEFAARGKTPDSDFDDAVANLSPVEVLGFEELMLREDARLEEIEQAHSPACPDDA